MSKLHVSVVFFNFHLTGKSGPRRLVLMPLTRRGPEIRQQTCPCRMMLGSKGRMFLVPPEHRPFPRKRWPGFRASTVLAADVALGSSGRPHWCAQKTLRPQRYLFWCETCQYHISRYGLLNIVVFIIGFLSNLSGGFRGSWAYPFAKAGTIFQPSGFPLQISGQGGGYSMDLNFAMLVLPTLKSLQTATRWMFDWTFPAKLVVFGRSGGIDVAGEWAHPVSGFQRMCPGEKFFCRRSCPKLLISWNATKCQQLLVQRYLTQVWSSIDLRCFLLGKDPINFHMVIAGFTFIGAFIHIVAHCVPWRWAFNEPLFFGPIKAWYFFSCAQLQLPARCISMKFRQHRRCRGIPYSSGSCLWRNRSVAWPSGCRRAEQAFFPLSHGMYKTFVSKSWQFWLEYW